MANDYDVLWFYLSTNARTKYKYCNSQGVAGAPDQRVSLRCTVAPPTSTTAHLLTLPNAFDVDRSRHPFSNLSRSLLPDPRTPLKAQQHAHTPQRLGAGF